MAVLDVVKLASTVVGVTTPVALFSASDDTSLQIKNCLNEAAAMIAFDANYDWSRLKSTATITGDGATELWNFPPDYDRMLKKAQLWPSSTPYSPLTHYSDSDQWLGMQVQNYTPIVGGWTVMGSQIGILPAIPAGATVKYPYIRNTIATDKDGIPKASFTLDTDLFPIGERLLKQAFIYRWKQERGQDYGEAMEDFQTALANAIGKDKGSNILLVGQQRMPQYVGIAWPGVLGA